MAELRTGQIVFSKCGRDKGLAFVIIKAEGEYLWLSDGDYRSILKPKKKKMKHVQPTSYIDIDVESSINEGKPLMDSDIRKCIYSYRERSSSSEEV